MNKYLKKFKRAPYKVEEDGVTIELDIYDFIDEYDVRCPATQHAIKKLMMPGRRGAKACLEDLREAQDAVKRAIELEINRSSKFTPN